MKACDIDVAEFIEKFNDLLTKYEGLVAEHEKCVEIINNVDKVMKVLADRRDGLLKNPADSFNYGRGVGLDEVLFLFGQPSRLFS